MEQFPEDYVAHNLPLILLSGLGQDEATTSQTAERSTSPLQEGGFRIRTKTPPLTDPVAQHLLQTFLRFDSSGASISGKSASVKDSPWAFKIQKVGRAYALPPRKAPPPPHAPRLGPLADDDGPPPPLSLHSTISPLTPTSPLYPDGIITPFWITKHQRLLPAVFVSFFSLTADPNTSSLHDNQIKTEIGNVRGVFSSTNYKTKVIIVLVGVNGANLPVNWDERLGNIRRATGLDSRQIFFRPPDRPAEADREFVNRILTSLQPFCVEYYRDLSKHTRRKRNRTHVPPPTAPPTSGTSRTLSSQGWNVRYEFKLGVFAEFRQEMDAACRNYESAEEGLFAAELFKTISSWSPRFNEARLLADAIAIRTLRCLLWTAQPTAAVRFWIKHRERTKDLVDRRGKGSNNYGWEAWQVTWSKSFAQLLASARNLEVAGSDSTEQITRQYFSPEKSIPTGGRIAPWEYLHHLGYWWNLSWKGALKRRDLAHQMPEEDRMAPGQSPASVIANRSHLYDAYLAREPHLEYPLGDEEGFDHSAEILSALRSTISIFSERQQNRFVERLRLEEAKEHLRNGSWQEARLIMRSLWPCLSWREAGWWEMVSDAAWTFKQAAVEEEDAESLLRLEWEAHNSTIPVISDWTYNFHNSLDAMQASRPALDVAMESEDSLSPIWACLNFATPDGNVGEPLKVQVVLTSTAHRRSEAIHLSKIEIAFEGPLRPIRVLSDHSQDSSHTASLLMSEVELQESSVEVENDASSLARASGLFLECSADISLQPGQSKIFELTCIPREPGEVRVATIKLRCETGGCSLTYSINQHTASDATWWSLKGARPQPRRLGRSNDATTVRILLKPPKVCILLPDMQDVYYANEKISLTVRIRNGEMETADVSVEARLQSGGRYTATMRWEDTSEQDTFCLQTDGEEMAANPRFSISRRSIGPIPRGDDRDLTLVIDRTLEAMQHELEITTHYCLLNDPETRLSKTAVVEVRLARPFEATHELLPRLEQVPWPSFFDPLTLGAGISQHFQLASKIACFVAPSAVIDTVSVTPTKVLGDAVCETSEEKSVGTDSHTPSAEQGNGNAASDHLRESSFDLVVRKNVLGDVRSVAADLTLLVNWRRRPGSELISTPLEVPRFVIPMGEPRVLLSKRHDAVSEQPGVVQVQYTIENPSMHYLTFNLAMESSDEFAFSGPKTTTFSLVPVSRHTVCYRILAHQRSKWLRISLGVTDAYFSKSLRIHPAGDGVRSDGKRGLLVWAE